MSACRSDFHGALGVFLPLYMRKIQIRCIRLGKGKGITFLMIGCNLRAARKVCDNLLHGMNGIDCHSFYQSRFFCISNFPSIRKPSLHFKFSLHPEAFFHVQFPFFFWVQNSLFSSCTQFALISVLSGRLEIINGFHNVNDIHGVFDNINNIIQ